MDWKLEKCFHLGYFLHSDDLPIFTWNLDQALIKGITEVVLDSDSVYDSALCGCSSFYLKQLNWNITVKM